MFQNSATVPATSVVKGIRPQTIPHRLIMRPRNSSGICVKSRGVDQGEEQAGRDADQENPAEREQRLPNEGEDNHTQAKKAGKDENRFAFWINIADDNDGETGKGRTQAGAAHQQSKDGRTFVERLGYENGHQLLVGHADWHEDQTQEQQRQQRPIVAKVCADFTESLQKAALLPRLPFWSGQKMRGHEIERGPEREERRLHAEGDKNVGELQEITGEHRTEETHQACAGIAQRSRVEDHCLRHQVRQQGHA